MIYFHNFELKLVEGVQEIPNSVNENMLARINENCRRVQACLHERTSSHCLVSYVFMDFSFCYCCFCLIFMIVLLNVFLLIY